MSALLDDALQVLKRLPESMQDAAARTILECVAVYDDEQAHA
jgi:hypothetical protein